MKNTILLLFFPFLLSAQEVTRDTSYLTNSGGNFFNVNRIEYEKWYDFSTYKFKGEGKRIVWISYFAAGVLHGGREAYHAESTVFEKRFNARPQSFFGSEQWKRNYFDRDPDNGHKPNLFNPVRDYYHFSGAATKTIWIGGAFTIGMSKQPIKYKLIDLLIGTLITSGSASLTYNILR